MAWPWPETQKEHRSQKSFKNVFPLVRKSNKKRGWWDIYLFIWCTQRFLQNKRFGVCLCVKKTAKQCVYQWWEITPHPRHLRGIWFCIALQEKAHAFLVWPVRIEARHHHYLPRKVPYEAGRAEHRFTQTAKAFYHKAESSLWSPTGVWGKRRWGGKKWWTG